MNFARARLLVALLLFLGWLSWLAVAVYQARFAPDRTIVLSRAQLANASVILVAEVQRDTLTGLPNTVARVHEVIRREQQTVGNEVLVTNLPSALPPGQSLAEGGGLYLLLLTEDGKVYRIAGLPRSPGYERIDPVRPAIYPWNESTRTQLRSLGIIP